ncbi:MAG: P1 family peptidase [Chlorobiales bacterium]|nr:P1 family peptidase [Chlorobiales bacterium]
MAQAGPKNAITDIKGLLVGSFTDQEAVSGVTVVLAPQGAVAGVDVRGSAPGTRETDLLDPINLVEQVQAVVLAGGSVYGLAAAQGVVDWLAKRGLGFPLDQGRVAPIVPAAVLYDLSRGKSLIPPVGPEWGRAACRAAHDGAVEMGSKGAGTGASAGGLKGGLKGGLGTASELLPSGLMVGALAAVNPFGSVIDPATGRPWEIRLELNGEFGPAGKRAVRLNPPDQEGPAEDPAGRNTTLGVVAVDAKLTKAQAMKMAQMAQDGLARAIRPAHTMFDGDTVFCLATGERELPEEEGVFVAPQAPALTELGRAGADCLARAIIRAVLSAESLGGLRAFADLEDH